MKPYGIFVERAEGARKWDVDGNEYVDHVGGHGAMILGHSHPAVVAAVTEALKNGTHHGAGHPREVRWGTLIRQLVPSIERVRFTASGTEATLMALRWPGPSPAPQGGPFQDPFPRLARPFHRGVTAHFDGTVPVGVLDGIVQGIVQLPPWNIEAVRACLDDDPDIAAVILEPTAPPSAAYPTRPNSSANCARSPKPTTWC